MIEGMTFREPPDGEGIIIIHFLVPDMENIDDLLRGVDSRLNLLTAADDALLYSWMGLEGCVVVGDSVCVYAVHGVKNGRE